MATARDSGFIKPQKDDPKEDAIKDEPDKGTVVDDTLDKKELKSEDEENKLENGQGLSAQILNNGVEHALVKEKESFSVQESKEDTNIETRENGNHESVELSNYNDRKTVGNERDNENVDSRGKSTSDEGLESSETKKMGLEKEQEIEPREKTEEASSLCTKGSSELTQVLPQQKRSPSRGSPERSPHSGGNHKFLDEESRAEYMKIKSEVTGEGETSESEDDEETNAVEETAHHGSHSSPDAKTKAEYRKIKYEVTGEALTSESEDENMSGEEIKKQAVKEEEEKETSSSDEWTDILGNGLLKKRVLRAGKGRDTRPDRGQIVMMRTAGRLEDGTAVDWNQGFEFILGEGEVIQAFDIGVALIELDEVCELVTDARYAYGEQGRTDSDSPVPPNAKITYEIELLAVRDGPDIETMSDDERMKIGDKKRELGNDLYTRGDFSAAINCYQRAVKYLTPSSGEKVQELKMKCWNNLAAAQLKVKAYTAALTSCSNVLNINPDNVKAVFRKGKVLAAQGDLEQAIICVKKASHLEPTNKMIRSELTNLKQRLNSQNKQEKDMYERMVGGLGGKEKNKPQHSFFPWSLVFGATVVVLGGIVAALYLNKH